MMGKEVEELDGKKQVYECNKQVLEWEKQVLDC